MKRSHLLILLLFLVGDFRYFPLLGEIQQLVYPLFFLYALWVLLLLLLHKRKFDGYDAYLLVLLFTVPVYEAYTAKLEFGQPMLYGMLHERGLATLGGVLYLKDQMARQRVSAVQVGGAMLWLAWFSAIIYTLMNLFVDPARFQDRTGLVAEFHGTPIFTPQIHFIVFGVLYYLLKVIRTRKPVYYLYALPLFAGGMGARGGRGLTVMIAATYLVCHLVIRGWKSFAARLPLWTMGLAIGVGTIALLAPDFFAQRAGEFSDAFTVVLTGSAVADESANARIAESLIALQGIQKHPVLGNGSLSVQWGGGPNAVLGSWFSPGDVGLLGALWQYGTTMVLLFCMQYVFILRAVRRAPKYFDNPDEQILTTAVKGFLLFFLGVSIFTGQFIYDVQLNALCVVLLPVACQCVDCRGYPPPVEAVQAC